VHCHHEPPFAPGNGVRKFRVERVRDIRPAMASKVVFKPVEENRDRPAGSQADALQQLGERFGLRIEGFVSLIPYRMGNRFSEI